MDRVILTAAPVGNVGMVGVSVVLVRVWSWFRLSFRSYTQDYSLNITALPSASTTMV